jgi:hypothetical protein
MAPVSLKQNIAPPKQKAAGSLEDMIERAYETHLGDTKAAARALEGMILANEEIFFEVMKPHLYSVCYQMLMDGNKRARHVIWSGDSKSSNTRAKAAVTGNRNSAIVLAASNLLLFPLPSGMKLGSATRAEITAAADHYAKLSADTGHKARWLTLIAQALGDGEKVSDKFTEERLAELKKEAEHAE